MFGSFIRQTLLGYFCTNPFVQYLILYYVYITLKIQMAYINIEMKLESICNIPANIVRAKLANSWHNGSSKINHTQHDKKFARWYLRQTAITFIILSCIIHSIYYDRKSSSFPQNVWQVSYDFTQWQAYNQLPSGPISVINDSIQSSFRNAFLTLTMRERRMTDVNIISFTTYQMKIDILIDQVTFHF